jgi:hypothetical protein
MCVIAIFNTMLYNAIQCYTMLYNAMLTFQPISPIHNSDENLAMYGWKEGDDPQNERQQVLNGWEDADPGDNPPSID